MTRLVPLLLAAVPLAVSAQDGGLLFTTYCAACHGANGEGAMNGQFPPLAGSPYPVGNADRAIKIALMGLHGPIEVNGHTWNLEMPPQGAALPDDQIAAILTFVRSSWGNKAEAVKPARVAEIRASLGGRNSPWTAQEILKLHPLEIKPPLTNLVSHVYDGAWNRTPDFTKLTPAATEEENSGVISISKVGRKDHFGVVWEGVLDLPADATYDFLINADDGGKLILDGATLAEVTGIGPLSGRARQGTGRFSKGPHKLRVEYYEFEGQEEIRVAYRMKGAKTWVWLTDKKAGDRTERQRPEIPVEPVGNRPAIYRNFIRGTTPRSIGFGFPGGVNLAWSDDHLAPELIWTGRFMDGGHHWTDRGQGAEPPAGERVVSLSSKADMPQDAVFKGFRLDAVGNPTFAVHMPGRDLLDSWKPGTLHGQPALVRTLALSGSGAPLEITVYENEPARPAGPGEYTLGSEIILHLDQGSLETKGRASLLKLTSGTPVTITYGWR